MRTEISEIIIGVHNKLTGDRLGIPDIEFLLHTSRRCDILCVFVRRMPGPLYIIKLSRNAENKARLANEADSLRSLGAFVSDSLKATIPVVLFEGALQGHYLIVENFLSGMAFNEKLYACRRSKEELSRIYSLITDWQIDLHTHSSSLSKSIPDFLDSGFWRESLEKYRSANPQEMPRAWLEQIEAALDKSRSLADCVIPQVLGHNDFSPYNVIYDPGQNKIKVIDWATSSDKAAPLLGLFNFFTVSQSVIRGFEETKNAKVHFSFSRNVHNVMPDNRDLLELFYRRSWQNELISKNINRYIQALGLDKRILPLLFLLFILRHMNHSSGALELCLQKEKDLLL
jgi:hypothetical protein